LFRYMVDRWSLAVDRHLRESQDMESIYATI